MDDNDTWSRYDLPLDLEKFTKMGLGRGVDCVSHVQYDLLDQQIDLTKENLEQLTVERGYSSFRFEVEDWYKIQRSLHSGISSSSGLPVKVDFGVNADRKQSSRTVSKCEGEMIHTRTVRLVIGVPTEE
jgi:hypothetical protein